MRSPGKWLTELSPGDGRSRIGVVGARRRYKKKATSFVTAVQFNVDTAGFTYQKWGAEQRAKQGDWLVDNDGDVYTVDAESFARTYRKLDAGKYVKTTPIWAEVADAAGAIPTKEGKSHYEKGDYIVFNEESGGDGYAVAASKFEEMYEED